MPEKREKEEESKIDGNLIASPKNVRKLYGKKKLDPDDPTPELTEDTPIPLPDNTDENMFPSAP